MRKEKIVLRQHVTEDTGVLFVLHLLQADLIGESQQKETSMINLRTELGL